jgi:hypothetical protein
LQLCTPENPFTVCLFCERGREEDLSFKSRKETSDEPFKLMGRREGEGDSLFPTIRYFPRRQCRTKWGLPFYIKVEGK